MKKVKEAKWTKINETEHKCANCGFITTTIIDECPNCKAVMKEDE